MPVRLRLTALAALGAAVAVLVGGAVFLHLLRSSLHTSLDSSLRSRADALVQTVGDATQGIDFQDQGSTRLLPANEALAQVLDPSGRVVESTEEAGTTPLLTPATLRTARTRTVYAEVRPDGDPHAIRLLAAPAPRADGRWIVVVGSSLEAADNAVATVRTGLVAGGVLTVVLAGGGAWLLGALALRPVERMRRQAATISEHDADGRLPIPATNDEIAELGRTINALLARLQTALVRQRQFVADAGHELRTPLAILRTELELAARPGREPTELTEAVTEAARETERLSALAEQLLFLARHDEQAAMPVKELHPVRPLLDQAVDAARIIARTRDVTINLDAPHDLSAEIVAEDLRRAIDNLLANALRHAPRGSAVDVTARVEADELTITVRDRGPGFPPAFLPHAFERFRRGDTARQRLDGGTGLGLAIVRAVAREHGGDADARNHPDGGALVTVHLPARR